MTLESNNLKGKAMETLDSYATERRERKGLLFHSPCATCGCCIDDHIEPDRYGITDEAAKLMGNGRCSLFSCKGFKVRKSDLKHIVYVCARRLFFGERQAEDFWEHPGVKEAAQKLLEKKLAEWEETESKVNKWCANYGSVMMIGLTRDGRSLAFNIGTA